MCKVNLILLVSFLTILAVSGFAQTKCEGEKILTEKKCAGDDISIAERELYKLINEYRKQNRLPEIPLSDTLSIVANRHLLDISLNLKTFTHGWSNCHYDIKNNDTWKCVFDAPKRLKVEYDGKAYENLYRNNNGNATPALALAAWKKSPMHNALILNLDTWNDTEFNAFGIAINGNQAAIWFGAKSGIKNALKDSTNFGLGVTFDNAVKGLTDIISIKKASSTAQNEQWAGSSPDKSVLLEVAGTQADVSQATIGIKIKLEKNYQINKKNRDLLSVFLNNIVSGWNEREFWVDSAIKNIQAKPNVPQTIFYGNKMISMTIDSQNYLSITIKPRPVAKEIK